MAKLFISSDLCVGHGRCYVHAPDLLNYDDGGFVIPQDTDIEVSEADMDAARDAAASCPEGAITFTL